ncbi:TPA: restriction endonuclease subunit S [Photobacterium damselae]
MVPNGWEKTFLKNLLCTSIKNGYSPNAVEQNTGYVVLGLGALTDHTLDTANIKNIEATEQVLKTQLRHGDFLISRSNTPDKVGRSVMFRGEIPNCSYPDLMMKFRADESKVDPSYLEIYLQSPKARQYFKNCAAGSSSSMVKINKSVVEKTPILKPSLPEQRKIAQILSTWDKAIAATEKLTETSKQQKKALMQQLLTGKRRLVNPETGKAFEGEWKNVSLKKLISEVKKTKEAEPNNVELLTVKLHHKGVKASGKYPNATKGGRPYYKRHKGELIIGRQNLHNGGIAIVTEECDGLIASNAISSFEVTSSANVQFILNKMSTAHFIYTIDNLTGGTGQKEISVKELLKIKISIPSIKEQQKIAFALTAADKELEVLEAKLAHFKQEKKALMQQLLTGKCRIKVDEMEAA